MNDSWLTFRQTLSIGDHVRKGERGTTVVYADRFIHDDEKWRAQETGEELRGRDFVCFCAPRPCHGDLLLRLANATRNERIAWWRKGARSTCPPSTTWAPV